MKCKKFLALVMTAVLSVSMLAGCSGGGGGVSGSISTNQVNDLLEDVGSDIEVEVNSKLNNAVRAAAQNIAKTGSTGSANREVSNAMGWSIGNVFGDLIRNFLNGGALLGSQTKYGMTYVVEESRLENNTGSSGLLGMISSNKDKINKLGQIDEPEEFAAALVLGVDGTVGQLDELSNGLIRFTYNVSGSKAKTEDGTVYWVFGAQVTANVL